MCIVFARQSTCLLSCKNHSELHFKIANRSSYFPDLVTSNYYLKGLQINLYLEQPMEIQLFATFFQRRK
jgi:hypothetical protein